MINDQAIYEAVSPPHVARLIIWARRGNKPAAQWVKRYIASAPPEVQNTIRRCLVAEVYGHDSTPSL